jgi:hypothetical protein
MGAEAVIRKWLAGTSTHAGARAAVRDLEIED